MRARVATQMRRRRNSGGTGCAPAAPACTLLKCQFFFTLASSKNFLEKSRSLKWQRRPAALPATSSMFSMAAGQAAMRRAPHRVRRRTPRRRTGVVPGAAPPASRRRHGKGGYGQRRQNDQEGAPVAPPSGHPPGTCKAAGQQARYRIEVHCQFRERDDFRAARATPRRPGPAGHPSTREGRRPVHCLRS